MLKAGEAATGRLTGVGAGGAAGIAFTVVKKALVSGTATTFVVKPKTTEGATTLARLLRHGKKPPVDLTARIVDAAGNATTFALRVVLERK